MIRALLRTVMLLGVAAASSAAAQTQTFVFTAIPDRMKHGLSSGLAASRTYLKPSWASM